MSIPTFKISGKPVDLPTSWNDLTVSQMQTALHTIDNDPELWNNLLFRLSVYTGIPYEEIQNKKIEDQDFEMLVDLLAFERTELKIEEIAGTIPNTIRFFDAKGNLTQTFRVPKKIEEARLGSKIMFMQEVVQHIDMKKSIVPFIHKAIAIYFQPEAVPGPRSSLGEPFDTDNVQEFYEVCKRCKFVEAFPVATFFLMKSLNLTQKKKMS